MNTIKNSSTNNNNNKSSNGANIEIAAGPCSRNSVGGGGLNQTQEQPQAAANDEPILWPSERVAPGGLFHAPKVEYSKETADLLRLLMKESKMSMMMRKQIDYHLRNGEPLPKPEPPRINTSGDPDANTLEILRRARNAKRKSLDKILASGAYEPSYYRPRPDDRKLSEKDKRRLQEAMAGMRLADVTMKAKRKPQDTGPMTPRTDNELVNELLEQINERADWLAEMEELGEGRRYRDEIREQIAERLRRIKQIESKHELQKKGFRYID